MKFLDYQILMSISLGIYALVSVLEAWAIL